MLGGLHAQMDSFASLVQPGGLGAATHGLSANQPSWQRTPPSVETSAALSLSPEVDPAVRGYPRAAALVAPPAEPAVKPARSGQAPPASVSSGTSGSLSQHLAELRAAMGDLQAFGGAATPPPPPRGGGDSGSEGGGGSDGAFLADVDAQLERLRVSLSGLSWAPPPAVGVEQ